MQKPKRNTYNWHWIVGYILWIFSTSVPLPPLLVEGRQGDGVDRGTPLPLLVEDMQGVDGGAPNFPSLCKCLLQCCEIRDRFSFCSKTPKMLTSSVILSRFNNVETFFCGKLRKKAFPLQKRSGFDIHTLESSLGCVIFQKSLRALTSTKKDIFGQNKGMSGWLFASFGNMTHLNSSLSLKSIFLKNVLHDKINSQL